MNQRKVYGILSMVVVAGMLASFGYVWYEYVTLTAKAGALSAKTAATALPVIQTLLKTLGISIAISAGASVLAVLLVLLTNRSSDVQVVYVKKNEESQYGLSQTTDEQNEEAGQHFLGNIETIINDQNHTLKSVFENTLVAVCRELEASQAAFFVTKQYEGKRVLELFATYAYHIAESKTFHYEFGEGLAGQVAKEGRLVRIKSIPEGYITILSGLGKASPAELIIAPVLYNEQVVAVLEIASFKNFVRADETFVEKVTQLISQRLANQYSEEEVISLVTPSSLALS